jgi:hypothetical protein
MMVFLLNEFQKNNQMKNIFLLSFLICISGTAFCQSAAFTADSDKAFGLIKNGAFKNGYGYVIKYGPTKKAAISVKPNTSYLVFYVYDNTNHPAPHFKASLMTPDSALQKIYTVRPFDRAQVGVARAAQLEFRTPAFTGAATRPVKFVASPDAIIYVFDKK